MAKVPVRTRDRLNQAKSLNDYTPEQLNWYMQQRNRLFEPGGREQESGRTLSEEESLLRLQGMNELQQMFRNRTIDPTWVPPTAGLLDPSAGTTNTGGLPLSPPTGATGSSGGSGLPLNPGTAPSTPGDPNAPALPPGYTPSLGLPDGTRSWNPTNTPIPDASGGLPDVRRVGDNRPPQLPAGPAMPPQPSAGGGGNPMFPGGQPLAAFGYTRGPNGEIMPLMLQQGMNPFQLPHSGGTPPSYPMTGVPGLLWPGGG